MLVLGFQDIIFTAALDNISEKKNHGSNSPRVKIAGYCFTVCLVDLRSESLVARFRQDVGPGRIERVIVGREGICMGTQNVEGELVFWGRT